VRGQPKTGIVVLGVNALARETSLSRQTVSRKMRKGATAADIRRYAALRESRLPATSYTPVGALREPKDRSVVDQEEYRATLRARQKIERLDDAKLRRARALAEKYELEVQELRASLVPRSYLCIWSKRLLACSREALSKVVDLSEVLAAENDPMRCNQILRSAAERILTELCERDDLWCAPSMPK